MLKKGGDFKLTQHQVGGPTPLGPSHRPVGLRRPYR